MDRTACIEPQCLYNGALYLYLYLYSPYGPYSLYRASVPVQRRALPLPFTVIKVASYVSVWTVASQFSYRACFCVLADKQVDDEDVTCFVLDRLMWQIP